MSSLSELPGFLGHPEFAMALDAVPANLIVAGLDGRIAYLNRRWVEYTGRDLQKHSTWADLRVIHPDDLPRLRQGWERDVAERRPLELQFRLKRADGAYRWHEFLALPADVAGVTAAYVGKSLDIHDRVVAEQELARRANRQQLLDDASLVLSQSIDYGTTLSRVADLLVPGLADGCVVDVFNDGQLERAAVRVAPDIPGDFARLSAEPAPLSANDARQLALESGRAALAPHSEEIEKEFSTNPEGRRALAEAKPAQWLFVPLIAGGTPVGLLGLFSAGRPGRAPHFEPDDIALVEELGRRAAFAVHNARQHLVTTRLIEDLEDANQAKDEFLGMVSHELRSPLTTIIGHARVLLDRGETMSGEDRQLSLSDILQDAMRLQRAVEDLLVLSRKEFDVGSELEPVLLQHIVKGCVGRHKARYPWRTITLKADARTPVVAGSETYLEHVVRNLLDNAEKYSPRDEPIDVEVGCAGDRVCVSVADRGPGVPEDQREAIFEAFHRTDSAKRMAGGAGLGLAVCRRLVEAQRGNIGVAGRLDGPGAVFRFCLPVDPEMLAEGERS